MFREETAKGTKTLKNLPIASTRAFYKGAFLRPRGFHSFSPQIYVKPVKVLETHCQICNNEHQNYNIRSTKQCKSREIKWYLPITCKICIKCFKSGFNSSLSDQTTSHIWHGVKVQKEQPLTICMLGSSWLATDPVSLHGQIGFRGKNMKSLRFFCTFTDRTMAKITQDPQMTTKKLQCIKKSQVSDSSKMTQF